MSFLFEILWSLVAVVLIFFFGRYRGKKGEEAKRKEKELENAKEVLEVRPSVDVDAALKRLSQNGKLRSVSTTTPND